MKRIMMGLLMATAMLAGCDSFVPPEVDCRATPGISLDMTLKPERTGVCALPEVQDVVIAYAPQALAASPGDLSLANVAIKVTASGASTLCDGPQCTPNLKVLDTALDERGTLTYTVRLNMGAMNAMPSPGGTVTLNEVVALESYGPGNACPVVASGTITCEESN